MKLSVKHSFWVILDEVLDVVSTFGVFLTIPSVLILGSSVLFIAFFHCYTFLGSGYWGFADKASEDVLSYGPYLAVGSLFTAIVGFLLSLSQDVYRWILRQINDLFIESRKYEE